MTEIGHASILGIKGHHSLYHNIKNMHALDLVVSI